MALKIKHCIRCGSEFHNQYLGISANAWERRKYCSTKCGNQSRSRERTEKMMTIDTDTPLFRFLSGKNRLDLGY